MAKVQSEEKNETEHPTFWGDDEPFDTSTYSMTVKRTSTGFQAAFRDYDGGWHYSRERYRTRENAKLYAVYAALCHAARTSGKPDVGRAVESAFWGASS